VVERHCCVEAMNRDRRLEARGLYVFVSCVSHQGFTSDATEEIEPLWRVECLEWLPDWMDRDYWAW
jgi:hypothetical protein